ncbi:predicted protein [Plenodomus lingam JN3]|uniref:Predicted protein n=1 Tax=Leptosphaeria maculans (strain JN3 / isolate v23.1.3 / race Av1-4-5-6-7-8) TaxID=985895 RepID=E5A8J2_LEPMJ|nr:predicted protein [Plenodomus lingam JN3]CBX99937.1 predicted protein [Plenodomus lingam JN3]
MRINQQSHVWYSFLQTHNYTPTSTPHENVYGTRTIAPGF